MKWTERRHGLVTFHFNQVLTEHSCFRSYLKRIGVYVSVKCPTGPENDEDVGYALFGCPRFREERERFRALWKSPLTSEGIGRCLLSCGQIKLHKEKRRKTHTRTRTHTRAHTSIQTF